MVAGVTIDTCNSGGIGPERNASPIETMAASANTHRIARACGAPLRSIKSTTGSSRYAKTPATASGLKFGTTPVALRLECRGNEADPLRLRLYANGKFLGEGVDPSPWASGGAGFIVASLSSGGVVAFLDDFTLATPT